MSGGAPLAVANMQAPGIAITSTATVLVLDVSGSMGDPWQGGMKLESAKKATADIVTMMQQEGQISDVSHAVSIATFSTVGCQAHHHLAQ
jgi:hypothetical protein